MRAKIALTPLVAQNFGEIHLESSFMRLVFLHAFPLNASMWKQQESIAPGRTTCPNLYRLGASLEEWAASVLALNSPEEPIIVIGSSMGGSCAIEMARQAPNRIAALVLVGTKAGHRPEPELRDAYIQSLRSDGINGLWPEVRSWFSETTHQDIVALAYALGQQQRTDDLINAVRVFHGRADLEHVLSTWGKPYLVISGERDPIFPKGKSERISKLGSNGRLQTMTDCGHFMNMERPAEFNRIVCDFIAALDSSTT